MKKFFIGVALSLFGATILFAGCKLALTPATADPNESPDVMYAKVFKDYVEAKSNGKIKVEVFPGGQLGSAAEMVQGVSSGAIEMAVICFAILWPHWGWTHHGMEYALLMGVVSLAIFLRGGGRYSVDAMIAKEF